MRPFLLNAFVFLCFFNALGQAKNEMHFQAKIENRNSDSIYIKDANYKTIKIIELNKEGIFKDVLTLNDGVYLMFDGAEYFKIYLKNEYDLQLAMDTNNIRETLVFSGTGSDINNYLVKEFFLEVDYDYGIISEAKNKKISNLIDEKEKSATKRLNANTNFDPIFIGLQINTFKTHTSDLKKYYGELREMN